MISHLLALAMCLDGLAMLRIGCGLNTMLHQTAALSMHPHRLVLLQLLVGLYWQLWPLLLKRLNASVLHCQGLLYRG